MRDTPTAARWLRDPDAAGERYAGWTLVSTEDGRALADIVPVWAGAARDSGAPTDWRAAVHGEPIGEFGGVNAAKAAIRATLTSTPRRPHRALTPSPGPFGPAASGRPARELGGPDRRRGRARPPARRPADRGRRVTRPARWAADLVLRRIERPHGSGHLCDR